MPRAALLLLLPFLTGCLAYPDVYWRTLKGTARVEDGKPVTIKAAIVKTCESVEGEAEFPGRERQTTTDAQGHYRLGIHGMTWRYKNFVSLKNCTSRLQMYVCRQYCKEADQVDIDVLGK
jgi:hypothetical protein